MGCMLLGIAGLVAFRVRILRPETSYYSLPEMIAMSLLLGLGNALFHVGAGVRVLQMGERMTPLGIFVSTGAFGICLGGIFCDTLTSSYASDATGVLTLFSFIVLLLSFAAAAVVLMAAKLDSLNIDIHKNGQTGVREAILKTKWDIVGNFTQTKTWNAGIIFLLFLVVALRSFQGSFVRFSWNTGIPITLLFALCIVAGKALGGILADCFGVPLSLLPLLLSALLFLQSEKILFGLGAILLFQTTMPITLSLMYRQLPGLPGTAFGLLSFALFVGYLPKYLFRYSCFGAISGSASVGDHFLASFSSHVAKWWWEYWEPYVYSIVTGISFLLLVVLLYLCHRKER